MRFTFFGVAAILALSNAVSIQQLCEEETNLAQVGKGTQPSLCDLATQMDKSEKERADLARKKLTEAREELDKATRAQKDADDAKKQADGDFMKAKAKSGAKGAARDEIAKLEKRKQAVKNASGDREAAKAKKERKTIAATQLVATAKRATAKLKKEQQTLSKLMDIKAKMVANAEKTLQSIDDGSALKWTKKRKWDGVSHYSLLCMFKFFERKRELFVYTRK